ncbi:hypothetical protein EMIHUDRAFT_446796 [Emiliania huxleyi CCMP1516]|uniref:Myb-like domain-containing protein n=2 Tax=Emiliania huxleyi TaxID=2903 RepID=A0A0D3KWU4_EMIH1|nr:hypothetical protein EMIHUDRAFT_446796 [Emiliania huxleyi CCMP1516]EOD40229.1 hypothetical protein EMIHUDRAFT_446796 [Emiliania huxleyi CCMP1516]|eukprot:XP_005792658.1 hypothetical protein EMIHUDRAFT_446796 [Emiliania huxleyi CCMP1516]
MRRTLGRSSGKNAAMTGGVHEHMRAWEPEEDLTILRLLGECAQSGLGPNWSRIAVSLPGRTVSSVRNRWQRIEKGRKLREAGHAFKNRCQRCGAPKRGHVCLAKLDQRASADAVAAAGLGQPTPPPPSQHRSPAPAPTPAPAPPPSAFKAFISHRE